MLSVSEAVSSSFTDSRATLMTYRKALYICLAIAALAGLLGIFFPTASPNQALVAISAFYYVIVLSAVLSYFGLAAAVRTIRPDFRMTIGRFFRRSPLWPRCRNCHRNCRRLPDHPRHLDCHQTLLDHSDVFALSR